MNECTQRCHGGCCLFQDELFQTFRQRRSIVSVAEYETDKASLERMLRDFESDYARTHGVSQPVKRAHALRHTTLMRVTELARLGCEVQDQGMKCKQAKLWCSAVSWIGCEKV